MNEPPEVTVEAQWDEGGPRLRWRSADGEVWRLGWISRVGGESLFPPEYKAGEAKECARFLLRPGDLRQPGAPIILLGEAGSGVSTLLEFVRQDDADAPPRVAVIDVSTFPDASQPLTQEETLLKVLARVGGADWSDLRNEDNQMNTVVRRLVPGEAEPARVLVIRGLLGLDPRPAARFLSSIRNLFENRETGRLRALLLADSLDQIQTHPHSLLTPLCQVCVMPRFTKDEVEKLASAHPVLGPDLDATNALGRFSGTCVEWTGGQPLLTRLYLLRAAELVRDLRPVEKLAMTVGRWICSCPPPQVARWQQRLGEILLKQPEIRGRLGAYLEPRTDETISAELRDLYVAGWIGRLPTRAGRWGIRSRCHGEWALPVLRDPRAWVAGGAAGPGGTR